MYPSGIYIFSFVVFTFCFRYEVRACEYEDIRVMWEMLINRNNESEFVHSCVTSKKSHYWKFFNWAWCATPYITTSCFRLL
ncbi:hypothetical protein Lalb_Chr06g0176491 [Lupinus albus]|uniref:Uncharacterized protein n=1 Tax=Lupinus albus TaxID=3870 RepID=A0A6A4QFW6_LUPAL|nr:hypothetical protein Lalb_Chr06g0176491 [Lupinus albus]